MKPLTNLKLNFGKIHLFGKYQKKKKFFLLKMELQEF